MLAVHLLHPFNVLPAATRSALKPDDDYMLVNLSLETNDVNLAFLASCTVQKLRRFINLNPCITYMFLNQIDH